MDETKRGELLHLVFQTLFGYSVIYLYIQFVKRKTRKIYTLHLRLVFFVLFF